MLVGLTGNIGSGKSTIAKAFKTLGCIIFNSDEIAKEAYFNKEIKENVISLLGPEAFDGIQPNKAYISNKIFNDKILLNKINQIIHPYVQNRFADVVSKNPNKLIIKESALLIETGLYKELDKTILVVADNNERLQRIIKRDEISETLALKKMQSQLPQSEKIKLVDFVIENNNTSEVLNKIIEIFNILNT